MWMHNDPFDWINQWQQEAQRRNQRVNGQRKDQQRAAQPWVPAVDIYEANDRFEISLDLPGMSSEQVSVDADNNVLSISGKRQRDKDSDQNKYKRMERSFGAFARKFNLPDSVDTRKIHAKMQHGVLTVTIPKQQQVQAKRIHIEH